MGVQDRDWYWKELDKRASRRNGVNASRWRPARAQTSHASTSKHLHPALVASLTALVVLLAVAFVATYVQSRAEQQRTQEEAERAAFKQRVDREAFVARKVAEEARQSRIEAQEARRLNGVVAARQEIDGKAQAATEAAARKDHAWADFYRPSAGCATAQTVQCANEYIRAKRAFESMYR